MNMDNVIDFAMTKLFKLAEWDFLIKKMKR